MRIVLALGGNALLRRSDAVCSALQLINFWQDIELDFAKGRIYLPQDDMARDGVTERQIAEQRCDQAWQSLMKFEVERSREMILRGKPLARSLPGRNARDRYLAVSSVIARASPSVAV